MINTILYYKSLDGCFDIYKNLKYHCCEHWSSILGTISYKFITLRG